MAICVKGTWTVIVTGASMVEVKPPTVRRDLTRVGTQVAEELVLVGAIHEVMVMVDTVGGAVVVI